MPPTDDPARGPHAAAAPIIPSLLDTDFYKLLMLQMIWRKHRGVRVRFSLINRSAHVRLAEQINETALRAELDTVRRLRFSRDEIEWLAAHRVFGGSTIFEPDFLDWLATVALPDYHLRMSDGQFVLDFDGPWELTTLWETPALAVISELRGRAAVAGVPASDVETLFAAAATRLCAKLEQLAALTGLKISDFGTRRRHGLDWQARCIDSARRVLGPAFTGTSNTHLAMRMGLEPVGTNAHELPMVLAALARTDAERLQAPYDVLAEWQALYPAPLRIILPDTYGTAAFLAQAPPWAAGWVGVRPDSGPPVETGERIIGWWKRHGQDPRGKLLIFSDALDVATIETLHRHFASRVRLAFGWGTDLTNDFAGCAPRPEMEDKLSPISIVCKVSAVDGRPAVKLSDVVEKATGPASEIARYLRLFGSEGRVSLPVRV